GSIAKARRAAEEALRSGAAANKLVALVEAQGGDSSVLDLTLLGHLPAQTSTWGEEKQGIVTRMDAGGIGRASLATGAGRSGKGDAVDPAAGLRIISAEGERTRVGQPVIELMASSPEHLQAALSELEAAITISEQPAEHRPLIIEVIPPEGLA
ncbi:MAG TPA: pyrimidine-nucleoside phosphorylase, partial [Armatimonadetes bacterium]|nr:pyrimidine-nucleoside phosphorylase [Armatimonadota bacterium]